MAHTDLKVLSVNNDYTHCIKSYLPFYSGTSVAEGDGDDGSATESAPGASVSSARMDPVSR